MTLHVPLPASLDPLVAEAKRRMRQRRLLVALLGLLVVGATIAGWLELGSTPHAVTSHFVATRPVRSAFAGDGSIEAGGRPLRGLDGGVKLRFIPSAWFEVGILLRNDASHPVTLTDVRAVFPHGSAIQQLGTALAAWHPRPCPPGASCPAPPGGISQGRNHGALRPNALQVTPGKSARVQLNFRFLGCPQARHSSVQNVSQIDVTYRAATGTVIHQLVPLGYSTLKIGTPHPCSK
jgi:hypothetical protein